MDTMLTDFFFGDSAILSIFKALFVITAILYVGFAVVVTRQIKVMRTTLITSFSSIVRVIGYAHLVLSLFVLWLFITIL